MTGRGEEAQGIILLVEGGFLLRNDFLLLAKPRTHSHDSLSAVSDRKNTLCAVDSSN